MKYNLLHALAFLLVLTYAEVARDYYRILGVSPQADASQIK